MGDRIPTFPADLQQLSDHWWWRPGMRTGRRIYACHLNAFGAQLRATAAHYQRALRPVDALDLIPAEWLHLTMCDVGFTDEVEAGEIDQLHSLITDRLSGIGPFGLDFDRPTIFGEGVTLTPVRGGDAVAAIQKVVRGVIEQVIGMDRVPPHQRADFHPHVSIAYANGPESIERVTHALSTVPSMPASERIERASLIAMHRDHRMYQWREVKTLPLGIQRNG